MIRIPVMVALLTVPSVVSAGPAEVLAPLIDRDTLAVGHLNLRDVEAEPIAKLIAELTDEEPARVELALRGVLSTIKDVGIRDLYTLYSAVDLPELPCLLVPLDQIDEDKFEQIDLRQFLPADWTSEKVKGFRVFGTSTVMRRLRAVEPMARPEFAQAFGTVENADVVIVATLTEGIRRPFEEIVPRLPEEVGGMPVTLLTQKFQWLTLGVKFSESFPLQLTARMADETAARQVRDLINNGIQLLGEEPFPPTNRKTRAVFGKEFDRLAERLQPTIKDQDVSIKLNLKPTLIDIHRVMKNSPITRLSVSQNNLKQIGLAMHNYADATGRLPANITDPDGKPLLSWRVAILPYLEQEALYRQFKLDEPWDSEHNKKLADVVLKVYTCPLEQPGTIGKSVYLGAAGPDAMFPGKPLRFADVTDGTSNTIWVLEVPASKAVPWTKPEDFPVGPKTMPKDVLGAIPEGAFALFVDGSVRFLRQTIEPATLRALFTRAGGEVIDRE